MAGITQLRLISLPRLQPEGNYIPFYQTDRWELAATLICFKRGSSFFRWQVERVCLSVLVETLSSGCLVWEYMFPTIYLSMDVGLAHL